MPWYLEIMSPMGHWSPQLWADRPSVQIIHGTDYLRSTGGHSPRVRAVQEVPGHLAGAGLKAVQAALSPDRVEVKPETTSESRVYLIRKHGAWYRPNSRGYTGSAIQAGRYTLAEAEKFTHPNGEDGPRDGMTYVHEDEVKDEDWQAFTALRAEARQGECDAKAQIIADLEHQLAEAEADAERLAQTLDAARAEILPMKPSAPLVAIVLSANEALVAYRARKEGKT